MLLEDKGELVGIPRYRVDLIQNERVKESRTAWMRIAAAVQRNREVKQLFNELCAFYPDPTPAEAKWVRDQMIEVLDEMNAAARMDKEVRASGGRREA